MFDKFTKSFTKKIIKDAKETVKDEVQDSIDKRLPIIFGIITVGITLLSLIEPKKTKSVTTSITIINNYYIYTGGPEL